MVNSGTFLGIKHTKYPLVNIQKAVENGHRNSGFSQLQNGGSFHSYVKLPEGSFRECILLIISAVVVSIPLKKISQLEG